LFGCCELFVGQRARIMELGELLKLGGEVRRRSLLDRGCGLLRRGGILLLLLVLLLLLGILRGIFLILVVVNGTGRTGDDCRTYRNPSYTSSSNCSSSTS
jgi:hypothetical protein